jgi:hypothetical protein
LGRFLIDYLTNKERHADDFAWSKIIILSCRAFPVQSADKNGSLVFAVKIRGLITEISKEP